MLRKISILTVLLAALLESAAQSAQKPSGPRPPVWTDDDMASIPEPSKHHDAMYFDFLQNTFGRGPQGFFRKLGGPEPAWNVNAWDQVPDSSWFTNRQHIHPMAPEEIFRGATQDPGPDLSKPLVVMEGKTAGTSLGFGRTRDARGRIYFIKFDPADYPEISTGAEVVGSRFFHALGFNVPQEWIIYFRPDQIQVDPKAKIWDKDGRQRKMEKADINEILARVPRLPDGRYRAVASLLIPGKIKGPLKFHGTRKDDPNDLIPHEHRRELRALRMFSAWLNHYDIRAGNTLDSYVEERGRKFLRHYLLDFGSTLGSASSFPKVPRMGNSYLLDPGQMAGPLLTLGLYQPAWRDHPAPTLYPSVGPFESSGFSPIGWKPVWPVASFEYMDGADAFWAARVIMSFTEEQIRAAVRAGEYSDPEAEKYVVRTLIERQHKIGRYAFSHANPLDQFRISRKDHLEFQDLAVHYGFAGQATTRYIYTMSSAGQKESLGSDRITMEPSIPVGDLLELMRRADPPGSLYVLTLRVRRAEPGFADKALKVYLEPEGSSLKVKGWEHES